MHPETEPDVLRLTKHRERHVDRVESAHRSKRIGVACYSHDRGVAIEPAVCTLGRYYGPSQLVVVREFIEIIPKSYQMRFHKWAQISWPVKSHLNL